MDWKLLVRTALSVGILSVLPLTAFPSVTRVQVCGDVYGNTAMTCDFGQGHLAIACIKTGATGGPPTITSDNNNWTYATGITNSNGSGAYCYYALNVNGGTDNVSMAPNGASFTGFTVVEYAGSGSFDLTIATAVTTNTATPTTQSFTTTDTDLILAYYGNQMGGRPDNPGTNFTMVTKNLSSYQATEEWLNAAAQTTTASFALGGTTNATAMVVMAFKNAPPVTASPPGIFWAEW